MYVCMYACMHACIFFLRFIYLLYVSTLYLSSDTPEEGIRSCYTWLWATMWLLGFELQTFGEQSGALTHWAISPARMHALLCMKLHCSCLQTHTRRIHGIPRQMVVGNWTQDLWKRGQCWAISQNKTCGEIEHLKTLGILPPSLHVAMMTTLFLPSLFPSALKL